MAEMNPGQIQECEQKLPLPIGVSNYSLAASEYYYIDKTMMIKDFIDERPMVHYSPVPGVLARHSIWICCALILKEVIKILLCISGIKKYGPADKSIEITRADIR